MTIKHRVNNIRRIRKILDISPKQLADITGYSEVRIYDIEKQTTPLNELHKMKFAKALQCSQEDLEDINFSTQNFLLNRGDIKHNTKTEYQQSYSIDDNKNIYNENDKIDKMIITIPMLDIIASAGSGVMNFSDDIKMQINFESFVKTTGLRIKPQDVMKNRYFFLEASGDSMSPFIEDGNILMIDTSQNIIEQYRQVMVFKDADGELYIKELHKLPGKRLSVISYNSNYKSYNEITHEELSNIFAGEIKIIGRVIWRGGDIDYWKVI